MKRKVVVVEGGAVLYGWTIYNISKMLIKLKRTIHDRCDIIAHIF